MLNLEPKRVFYFFEEIDKIPRNSGDEKRVSDFILAWAKEQGFDAVQDEYCNLVIKKGPSAGYEEAAPVILQAHLDMVCEKTPESSHDFTKDPITLRVDGDWVSSDCGTSLGADNGIGVAYAMAILEDDSLAHPPLEVIFTVCEESTFDGAANISTDLFCGKRIINLDNAEENQVLAGSCGGSGINFELPLQWTSAPEEGVFYKLYVEGMEGGHSGEDIHRGRGNAIELLIRLIRDEEISLCSMKAGSYRLAIPRDGQCTVMVDRGKEDYLREHVAEMAAIFKKEYFAAAPALSVRMEKTEAEETLIPADKKKIVQIIDLFPNGIAKMNGAIPGVVESSNNVGTIEVGEGRLFLTAETRAAYMTTVKDILDKVDSLAEIFGAEVTYFGGYVPWEFNPDSALRLKAQEVYRQMFGEEMYSLVAHAGIECAMFIEKDPQMDAIAIGPNCEYFHSPGERMSIKSTQKMYKFVVELLKNLK